MGAARIYPLPDTHSVVSEEQSPYHASRRYGKARHAILTRTEISPSARFLYALLTTYADSDGFCYPSTKELIVATGKSKATVFRWLSELLYHGVIVRKNQQGWSGFQLPTSLKNETEVSNMRQQSLKYETAESQICDSSSLKNETVEHIYIPNRSKEQEESVCSARAQSNDNQPPSVEDAGATTTNPTTQPTRPGNLPPAYTDPDNPHLLGNGWPTEQQVRTWATRIGFDDEEAWDIALWFGNRGWKDKNDHALLRWDVAISGVIKYRRRQRSRYQTSPKPDNKGTDYGRTTQDCSSEHLDRKHRQSVEERLKRDDLSDGSLEEWERRRIVELERMRREEERLVAQGGPGPFDRPLFTR